MFSHLHSTAEDVNEAKCGEGISAASLLNCISLMLFQSSSNQVRTTWMRETRQYAEWLNYFTCPYFNHCVSSPWSAFSTRQYEWHTGAYWAEFSVESTLPRNTKGSHTKGSFHLTSISFINRSETAASSFQQGWNLTAGYDTIIVQSFKKKRLLFAFSADRDFFYTL